MKKRLFFTLFLTVLILALTCCASSVKITTMIPSEVNLAGYKTIAFQSTEPYKTSYFFSNHWLYEDTAKYVNKVLEKAIDQGVYKIIGSRETDNYIKAARDNNMTVRKMLLSKGIDALVTSKVEYQYYDEDYYCRESRDKDGKVWNNYYVTQRAKITVSYVVHDVQTALIIDDGEFEEDSPYISTSFLGSVEASKDRGNYYKSTGLMSSPASIFENLVDKFSNSFKKRLTPYSKDTRLTLMSSKNERLKSAYEFIKNDMYKDALNVFMDEWNYSHDIAAGYNSIILLTSGKGIEAALDFADEVYDQTYSTEVLKLRNQLDTLNSLNKEANQQINGDKTVNPAVTELRGF